MKIFSDTKDPAEKIVLTFDFTLALATGESVTAVPTPSVAVRSGSDGAPAAMLAGTATIDATGKMVLVPVQGGFDMTDYLIKVLATTSNPLKAPALVGLLSVRS